MLTGTRSGWIDSCIGLGPDPSFRVERSRVLASGIWRLKMVVQQPTFDGIVQRIHFPVLGNSLFQNTAFPTKGAITCRSHDRLQAVLGVRIGRMGNLDNTRGGRQPGREAGGEGERTSEKS